MCTEEPRNDSERKPFGRCMRTMVDDSLSDEKGGPECALGIKEQRSNALNTKKT